MVHADIAFTNFVHNPDKYYFLFISELKAYGISQFFREALSKILFLPLEEIECITIAPDIFEQYNYDNLIIINQRLKGRENQRKSHDEFIEDISKNTYIDHLIDTLLLHQPELYLYMYESHPSMTLDQREGVTLIGPQSDIVAQLNNKITLYERFSDLVPMAEYRIVHNVSDLIIAAEELFDTGEMKLFVSLEKSAAGANSMIATSSEEIKMRFGHHADATFLLTRYIDHLYDPTTLAVVVNEEEVYVAGVADQRIEGTSFRGSTFPTKISHKEHNEIIRQTRTVGKAMARMGYRGIFGCDFIVTKEGSIYFIETNPRKQGTTMEFCSTLKTQLPRGAPNLPEIEFYAVTEGQRAPRMQEPSFFETGIYWGTYNVKMDTRNLTRSYLPQQRGEIEMFRSVAANKLNKEYMILEHIGQDYFVNKGSFLGRVIATGHKYEDIESGIEMGRTLIDFTLKSTRSNSQEMSPYDDHCKACQYYQQAIAAT